MPSSHENNTNQFRCEACGRYVNTQEELVEHQRECVAIKNTGSGSTETPPGRDAGEDREWVSVP